MTGSQTGSHPLRQACRACQTELTFTATATPELVICHKCGLTAGYTPIRPSSPAPLVAIIGTEGAGKTVLATTLAKQLSADDSPNLRMEPQGARTFKYVERVWQTLQSEKWPSSTAPGELFELKWKLEIIGRFDAEVRLIDAAGQDMRLLFGEDEIHSIESLPSHLRPLAEYCRRADIFLCLVNLKDFLGTADPDRKIVNESFLKSALDYLAAGRRAKRICLVLTQADQYLASAKKYGSWEKLVSQVIPNVFNSQIRDKHVSLIPVAAVGETRVAVEKGQKPRKVPKQGFKSIGLSKLITWLTDQIEDAKQEYEHEAETSGALAKQQAALQVIANQTSQPQKDFWQEFFPAEIRNLIAGKERLVSLAAAILLGGGCFLGTAIFSKPTKPVAAFLKKWDLDVPGIFDDGVATFGIIKNNGASGKIRVWARVTENGVEVERQSSDIYLNQGESANYFFTMNEIRKVSNPHSVDTWAEIP